MEVRFVSKKLAEALGDQRARTKKYGPKAAKKLALRLNQLASAENLESMRNLPGRYHELHGDRSGQVAVDLEGGLRMVFRPTADPPPTKEDGGLDWRAVRDVTIVEVTDYHD